ncbi:hypothetical protein LA76x_1694 [Lysobacter antibioticus]|uniref:Uncharacterized protein n=1 Tax=Lysobacter antibioticus TaxID=84531 RepID=A0A0S2F8H8_LYSAN|nr:hypothetical protein LA76x_1694 [Lysobacter antibioticus]
MTQRGPGRAHAIGGSRYRRTALRPAISTSQREAQAANNEPPNSEPPQ